MARACWNWRIRQFRVLDLSWVMASVPGCLIFFPLATVADVPSEIMCTFIKKACSLERRSLVFWILFSILNKIMANEIKINYLSLQFQTIFIFIHKEFRHNGLMHRARARCTNIPSFILMLAINHIHPFIHLTDIYW